MLKTSKLGTWLMHLSFSYSTNVFSWHGSNNNKNEKPEYCNHEVTIARRLKSRVCHNRFSFDLFQQVMCNNVNPLNKEFQLFSNCFKKMRLNKLHVGLLYLIPDFRILFHIYYVTTYCVLREYLRVDKNQYLKENVTAKWIDLNK